MKKTILAAMATLLATTGASHAANVVVSNVTQGVGDTLFVHRFTGRMVSGIVSAGYFPAGFDVDANLSQANWANLVANFTIVTSGTPGSFSATLDGSFAGYVEKEGIQIGTITGANPLLGRMLYGFVGGSATLLQSITDPSSSIGLFEIRPLGDDIPFDNTYQIDPTGKVIKIGTLGTFVGDAGAGVGTYNTFVIGIPEPSGALLGALATLGFLRRRR